MRTTINIEFTDEELRKFAHDVGRRWILDAVRQGARDMSRNPGIMAALAQLIVQASAASAPGVNIDAEFEPEAPSDSPPDSSAPHAPTEPPPA